ncbi:L,D-transpeptidase family protein [Comamonas flocculans]|uniref:L,D-transpeptidase family protein n=2 Tax=Comamonas flocculans TaxID=2597701 RepID=A0A5B8RZ73_9BURK|nr:L,D-transpeptidase family protein [Comamonas flocculans]
MRRLPFCPGLASALALLVCAAGTAGGARAGTQPPSAAMLRPHSAAAPLARELRLKATGPEVRELQIRLRHARYLATYDAHDKFDGRTRAAVENFQREHGLRPTGVVNQATWELLRQKSHEPTAAELSNTDVGPWFTGPRHAAFVMELQSRLKQAGSYRGPISGELDRATLDAIAAFRMKVGLPAAEVMDERTWARLLPLTRNPGYKQLFDAPPQGNADQQLDPRCTSGKVVCISKGQKKLSYVVDGQIRFTREARFSRPGWDSPEGEFRIWYMNRDTVSSIFGERTPMPYAIFYDGNVAIHFSDDFADNGYASGSHGCTQMRDYQAAKWLYEQVRVGDRVVVYP